MSGELVKLHQVCKEIRGKIILRNIDLIIERNKIHGIIGHNGSGKTMLLRAIIGLIYTTSGTVEREPDISIGAIIENPGFLPEYTGFQNLKLLAGIKNKITDMEIKEAMRRTGLNPGESKKVKAYSLGMKQKLAIAQAIMESPCLLLLDEPTNGLDSQSVEEIRELLLAEKQVGKTILIVSHNLEDIRALCDVVYQMENGEISRLSDW